MDKELVKYFMDVVHAKFDSVDEQFSKLHEKLDIHTIREEEKFDKLFKFKWTIIGGCIVFNGIISLIILAFI